ncbi:MAG: hypothetical protein J0H00_21950 [Burkholderiales bacterium]|nr:hypothetical protein [Burkholderiales bacterium]OJX05246.1 MAG: hypothetical protein BGO72_13500 [Burkholderiales bacterium 70-64]
MNEEAFSHSIRKFLRTVGVGSQREIEQAVAAALADGRLREDAPLPAVMTLEIAALGLTVKFDGSIELR